jgi:hypothetical protein
MAHLVSTELNNYTSISCSAVQQRPSPLEICSFEAFGEGAIDFRKLCVVEIPKQKDFGGQKNQTHAH